MQGKFVNNKMAYEIANTFSLKQIIHELRKQYDIKDRWCKNKKTKTRYKEFYLGEIVRRVF